MQYCPRLPDVYLPAVLEEVRSILKHLRQFPFIPAVMSYLRQVRIKAQPLLPDLLDFLPDSNSYYDHIGGLIYEFDPEGTIALPGLKGCLKSTNEFTRSMAADGLACFGERAAEALPMLLYIKEKQENRISESIQKAIRAIRG
jgi:HEAT repeat protein